MSMEKYVSYATQSFTFPNICLKIRDVLDDHRSDMDDVAKLIAVDPSLTVKILRLANSALFRFPSQIDSIAKAVSVIGGEALYNLVVAETANTAFKHFNSAHIRLDKHWYKSVYNGLLAKTLAKQSNLRGSERFFVMGILCHFSELVVAKEDPELYLAYLEDKSGDLPWEKQEKHFGFTFAACSGEIMEQWRLPLPLFFPVKYVHNTRKHAEEADIGLLACSMRVTIREIMKPEYGDIELFTPEMANTLLVEGETLDNAIAWSNAEAEKVSALIL